MVFSPLRFEKVEQSADRQGDGLRKARQRDAP
jgi:hypothetical protein